MKKLILASQSPRRRDILQNRGFHFETLTPQLSEKIKENIRLDDALMDLARQKARACEEQYSDKLDKNCLILTADTMVVNLGLNLGKPKDREEAKSMINSLSGQKHWVKTAICFLDLETNQLLTDISSSEVVFREIEEIELDEYLSTANYMDKAGAYGIQEEAGKFVLSFTGEIENIIGLPISLVEKLLKENHWNVSRN